MKILQINKFYHPVVGGVETVVKQYSEYLSQNGHEVIVLVVKKNVDFRTSNEKINGVKIVRCSSFGTFYSMPISLSFYYYFFKLKRKVDIIHFHEPFPLASILSVFKKKKVKYIVTWHSDIFRQKFIRKFFIVVQNLICKKADVITTTSPQLLKSSDVIAKYKPKVEILPLSINKKDYLNVSNQVKIGGLPKKYILYLGRLSYYKGIHFLLNGYEKLEKKIPLVIVGKGESDKVVFEYLKKYSKEIIFINRFVTEEEKLFLLQHCMFLVFPSIYPSEAFGILQLEAMIFEKPVINTNLSTGVPWVSKDKITGLTVEINDVEELKRAMEILIDRRDLRILYGKNARRRVLNHFEDSIVLKKLLEVYKKVER